MALHVGADPPVWQGQLQGLAFLDVLQHLRKARADSEAEGSLLFHVLFSTTRLLAGRLGAPAAAPLRPSRLYMEFEGCERFCTGSAGISRNSWSLVRDFHGRLRKILNLKLRNPTRNRGSCGFAGPSQSSVEC